MAEAMIQVQGLSKRYWISHTPRPNTLRDAISGAARALLLGGREQAREELWALHDVAFEVAEGQCVGILGRNGAGKSTLLKVLSRITEPTAGRVRLRGRVASLLEVGTGFHPELTGRENIFLNGAILGLSRAEIRGRFDAIVAFSEMERFLDTPVKHYSSGMYMRLAFAIAAHLEPEILVIDEVLAVGDLPFQRKCLGKMGEASRQGRTVLFVSHNLAALLALCTRGVVLEDGRLVALGPIQEAVQAYLQRLAAGRGDERAAPREHGFVRAQIVDVANPDAGPQASLDARRSYRLELRCRLPSSSDLNVGVTLFNEAEVGAISGSARDSLQGLPAGEVRLSVELPVSRLPSGRYRLEGAIWDPRRRYDQSDALLLFDVVNPGSAPEIAGLKPQGATLFDDPWTAEPAAR